MFVRKRDDDDTCLQGNAGCMPMYAIMPNPGPSEKNDDVSSSGPPQYEKPGPHRFIGIAAVAGMAFLILVAYLAFGRRPRRMRRKYCRCLGGRSDEEEEDSVEEGKSSAKREVAVVLESASASSAEEMTHRQPRQMSNYRTDVDRRSKSRRRSSRSRRRRSNATIPDGGAFSERKSAGVESGAIVTGWEVEHVGGVRYEARTPTDHQTEQRREIHIQKPSLVYISGNNR